MDAARARELLERERRLIDRAESDPDPDAGGDATPDPAAQFDDGAEIEVDEMTGEAVRELLERRRSALGRAEERLAAGTYGRSVLSGAVIPDERLEANPLAELTVDEETTSESPPRPF